MTPRPTSDATLFAAIHAGRPEHLAQLVLAHVLRTDAGARALVGVPSGDDLDVSCEETVHGTRWRADIVVRVGEVSRRLELKLTAPLSPQQRDADAARKIDVLVCQTGRDEVSNAHRITWAQLADSVSDPVAKALLRQADAARSVWRAEIGIDVLERELTALSASDSTSAATWTALYSFLSTLDAWLRGADRRYRPSSGWTVSRSAGGYYGFNFACSDGESKTRPWWVGFERDADRVPRLRLYRDGSLVLDQLPLAVEHAGAKILGATRI